MGNPEGEAENFDILVGFSRKNVTPPNFDLKILRFCKALSIIFIIENLAKKWGVQGHVKCSRDLTVGLFEEP